MKIVLTILISILISSCSKEDHIEKCVQVGLKSWEESQIFYKEQKEIKEKEELDKKIEKSEIDDCETQKSKGKLSPWCTGFTPAPFYNTQKIEPTKPETRNDAEFRIRSHCLRQSSGK